VEKKGGAGKIPYRLRAGKKKKGGKNSSGKQTKYDKPGVDKREEKSIKTERGKGGNKVQLATT